MTTNYDDPRVAHNERGHAASMQPNRMRPSTRGIQEHTFPTNYRPPSEGMDDLQRWVSGLGGAAILYYAMRQEGFSRWPLTALGAGLVYAGISGNNLLDYVPVVNDMPAVQQLSNRAPSPNQLRVRKSLTVNRPAAELYAYWRKLENLPTFMTHVKSVQDLGNGQSHWRVSVLHGIELEWDAQITVDRPNEMIAWETLPEADIQNRGYVKFIPIAHGTEVSVSLEYDPPLRMGGQVAGRAGKFIAEQEVKDQIRDFKRLMETGELPTTEGQSSGRKKEWQEWERLEIEREAI